MADDPTPEEVQRVREYECRQRGHTFTELYVEQHHDPKFISCENCGRTLHVVAEDDG